MSESNPEPNSDNRSNMNDNGWCIVQQESGHCEIVPASTANLPTSDLQKDSAANAPKTWGPFASEGEAIARRVGLIRSGRCKPM